jgi:predicted O-methyltransferase YrrM
LTLSVLAHYLRWSAGLAGAETQTTEAERACLGRHAMGRSRAAEVGVWHGVTTRMLAGFVAPGGVLYAIDPYPAGRLGVNFQRRIARREVAGVNRSVRVEWLRMTGVEAAGRLAEGRESVDFVFIDGDHSYDGLRADWEAWSPLVAPGGVVGLHDSRSCPGRNIDEAGSVRFVSEVIHRDPRFSLAEEVETLSVFRRAGG